MLQGRIIPQDAGERVAIAYAPSTSEGFSSTTMRGVMMASLDSAKLSLVSSDRATTESLFVLI